MGMNFFEALAYTFKIINTIAPTILVIIGLVVIHLLVEVCFNLKLLIKAKAKEQETNHK